MTTAGRRNSRRASEIYVTVAGTPLFDRVGALWDRLTVGLVADMIRQTLVGVRGDRL